MERLVKHIAKYDNCETNLSYSTRHDVATTTNIETYLMYYFYENLDLDACISYIIYVCIIRICLIYMLNICIYVYKDLN